MKPIISYPAQNWTSHFKSLHKKHQPGEAQLDILEQLSTLENNNEINNLTNQSITENDIRFAAKKLKNKKSAYTQTE